MGQDCSAAECCGKEVNCFESRGEPVPFGSGQEGIGQSSSRPIEMMSEEHKKQLLEMSSLRNSTAASKGGSAIPVMVRKIIKIQAIFRGYLVRQRITRIRQMLHGASDALGEFDSNIDQTTLLKNPKVLEVFNQRGPFQIPELTSSADLIDKEPFRLMSGAIYVGQWIKDLSRRAGKGRQVWLDGSYYEGQWQDGQASGIGRLIHSDGDVYEGEWVNDKANGKGKYYHYDGAMYDGNWKDDKQHGHGIETWPDEARYEGQYIGGAKQGQGHFQWSDGSSYFGNFDENDICGQGKYTWSDGRTYEGFWKGNKMHGRGVYRWKDGRIYDGGFADDKKEGSGTLSWPDGRKYNGMWHNGRQSGEGVFTNINGEQHRGNWLNGKVVNWIDDDGNQQQVTRPDRDPSDNIPLTINR